MSEETFILLLALGRACNALDAFRGKAPSTDSQADSGLRIQAPSREGLVLYTEAEEQKKKLIEYAKQLALRVERGR
jgi:hypothetical protein